MLKVRIIPCLQLINESLVKTVQFSRYGYIGDPINTVRIFNELEVDELCFLDIRATVQNRLPDFRILSSIANECFMPLSYGGGIRDLDSAIRVLAIGFEKIIINTSAIENPGLISQIARHSGNQSVIVSIDVKRSLLGNYSIYSHDGTKKTNLDPISWAKKAEDYGAGELLVTSIDREGTWKGFDLEILKQISGNVTIPVIANGGAGSIGDISKVVHSAKVSAVALGSMVVYQQKGMGVLVNFPDRHMLKNALENN